MSGRITEVHGPESAWKGETIWPMDLAFMSTFDSHFFRISQKLVMKLVMNIGGVVWVPSLDGGGGTLSPPKEV